MMPVILAPTSPARTSPARSSTLLPFPLARAANRTPRRLLHLVGGALLVASALAGPAPSAWAQAPAAAAADVAKSVKVADGIFEVVVSQKRPAVYVATTGKRGEKAAKVFELDPATLEVKRTIDVSAEPAFGLGLNDRTQTLYTTNTTSGSVSAIDLATGAITPIRVEADPKAHTREVVVDEEANVAYVSIVAEAGKVWVIDGKAKTVSHVIENVGKTPTGLALDTKGKRLFVTNMGDNTIAVVDLASRKVAHTWPAGGERPTNAAYDAASQRLFVTNQKTADVSVIDTKTGTVLKRIKTGEGALGVTLNPKTNRVYVANRGASSVTVIDAKSYDVVATVATGTHPNTIALDARTNAVYVTNKAKSGGRGAPPIDDPNGDTLSVIKQ